MLMMLCWLLSTSCQRLKPAAKSTEVHTTWTSLHHSIRLSNSIRIQSVVLLADSWCTGLYEGLVQDHQRHEHIVFDGPYQSGVVQEQLAGGTDPNLPNRLRTICQCKVLLHSLVQLGSQYDLLSLYCCLINASERP